jgi:hypothetical protein
MNELRRMARIAAGLLALLGLAGLGIRLAVNWAEAGSAGAALWMMLRYFTIIGNLLAMLTLAGLALGARRARSPSLIGGVTLNLALIGIVYATLLRGIQPLAGWAVVADHILHDLMPPLMALYWLVFAPRGLRWSDPLRWALLPLAYLPYALARAAADGKYAYPFIDAAKLGWPQVLANVAGLTAGFLLAGFALVWLDRRISAIGRGH